MVLGRLLINGTTYSEITADMISGFEPVLLKEPHVYVEYKGKQVVYSMEVVAPKPVISAALISDSRRNLMWKEMYSIIQSQYVCNDWWSCSLYLQWIYL